MENKVALGSIVHYVMEDGAQRPAIVVQVWSDQCVNLLVFTDVTNDGLEKHEAVVWETSVSYSDDTQLTNTWHFAFELDDN